MFLDLLQQMHYKKRIAITNYMYPNIGGIEQVARDIAASLKADGEIA